MDREELVALCTRWNQKWLIEYFNTLSKEEQLLLQQECSMIPWEQMSTFLDVLLLPETHPDLQDIHPIYAPHRRELKSARRIGERALRQGTCAALMVAGGLGTRLGWSGPKGSLPVLPISQKSLYQIFAERILRYGEKYGFYPYWLIMLSRATYRGTIQYFRENNYFGFSPDHLFFFIQRELPLFHTNGNFLLADSCHLSWGPDGHGGILRALAETSLLDFLLSRGVQYLSYFQVDNPLVRIFDPIFLGWHIDQGAEVSSKVIEKLSPEENVGVFCQKDGCIQVVEYSELSSEKRYAKDSQGNLLFFAGNPAIHIFNVQFLREWVQTKKQLPYHRALRPHKYYDPQKRIVITPHEPNSYKLEQFIFDLFPYAKKVALMVTEREEEFAPIKNREGNHTLAECRSHLQQYYRQILSKVLPNPTVTNCISQHLSTIEISPRLVADSEDLDKLKGFQDCLKDLNTRDEVYFA